LIETLQKPGAKPPIVPDITPLCARTNHLARTALQHRSTSYGPLTIQEDTLRMAYLFTSESVSEGHPDKIADQISDAILDALLEQDPRSRVAVETLVTTGLVVLSGEVTTKAYVDVQQIARKVIEEIGYVDPALRFDAFSCGVLSSIHEQSPDISQGVNEGAGLHLEQGAGDQGMMFGYATKETPEYMPMALTYAHHLVRELADIRKNTDLMPYLRPDSKSQVTVEYEDDRQTPRRVHTVVVSTQHDEDITREKIEQDVREHLLPRVLPAELVDEKMIVHVNPTGRFVIGGPHGDTGLTGRKIIVDTYGGRGAHGGGAFSGKDPSKVDRSAAYAARHVAKNLVAAGLASEVLVQVAYAIGVAAPISIDINSYGTGVIPDVQLTRLVREVFDLRPAAIIRDLDLLKPQFRPTAAYGHFGRDGFSWEALSHVDALKSAAAQLA
jgi:S-adenosylmethionine synthetase